MASASRFVRASKFRHVFGEPAKPELHYTDLELSPVTGDHNYIRGNAKFFAIAVRGGGGPVQVIPYTQVGKIPRGYPTVNGHSAAVYDTAWCPFNDNLLATGSDDTTVKLWHIPDGGLTEGMKEPLTTLSGHGKPVSLLAWNPVASDVIASVGKDPAVKIWDVSVGAAKATLEGFGGLVQDFAWNGDGSLLLTSSKDKLARIQDPRTGGTVTEWTPHEGGKAFKVLFMGDRSQVLTVGFTKQSKREFKVWDIKTLSTVATVEVDQAAGVMMPFYDDDIRMLYLTGKGDGNVRYYEFVDEAPFVYPLSEYRTNVSTKGADFLPKRACAVLKCEVARMLKLTAETVEPISFIVPRKSEAFQEDIFPETYAGKPALTADAWFSGAVAAPKKVSLDPAKGGAISSAPAPAPAPVRTVVAAAAAASTPAPAPAVTPAAGAPEPEPVHESGAAAVTAEPAAAPEPAPAPAAVAVTTPPAAAGGDAEEVSALKSSVEELRAALAAAQERIAELEAQNTKLKKAVATLSA